MNWTSPWQLGKLHLLMTIMFYDWKLQNSLCTKCPLWWDVFSKLWSFQLAEWLRLGKDHAVGLKLKMPTLTYLRDGRDSHNVLIKYSEADVFSSFSRLFLSLLFSGYSIKTSLKDYLSGYCFTCRLLSLHLVFLLQLPAAVLSFVTHQPWIRNTNYTLLINETTENISYTTWDSSALCSFSNKPQRHVQSTKGCLGVGGERTSKCISSPQAVQYNV